MRILEFENKIIVTLQLKWIEDSFRNVKSFDDFGEKTQYSARFRQLNLYSLTKLMLFKVIHFQYSL